MTKAEQKPKWTSTAEAPVNGSERGGAVKLALGELAHALRGVPVELTADDPVDFTEEDLPDLQDLDVIPDATVDEPELEAELLRSVRFSSDDLVGDYIKSLNTPLLTAEEEVELSRRIEAGLFAQQVLEGKQQLADTVVSTEELEQLVCDGNEAKERFVQANLRLVVTWAGRRPGGTALSADLIQEGNLGLIRAVEKFDFNKGYKFSTYATWWIRQSIDRAQTNDKSIRLPVRQADKVKSVGVAISAMRKVLGGRLPTDSEVIALSGAAITPEVLNEYYVAQNQSLMESLDRPVGEGGGTLGDSIADENSSGDPVASALVEQRRIGLLDYVKRTLKVRHAQVVTMRYGLDGAKPMLQEEVARLLGVTRNRVGQIEKAALERLREHPDSISDYAD